MSKQSPASKRKPKSAKVTASKANATSEPRNISELNSYPKSWYIVCGILYGLYCYAAFFPVGPVWGIHWMAYIPQGMKIILLIVGGLLLIPGIQRGLVQRMSDGTHEKRAISFLPIAAISIISFFIFRTLALRADIYGDNIYMLKEYGDNAIFDWNWIGDVFSAHWVDNKEALTVAVHRVVANFFSLSIGDSYKIVSEICGALFVFLWLFFIQKITADSESDLRLIRPLRWTLAIVGLFSGGVLVFFGHVENYAFGILTFSLFLSALYFYLQGRLGTIPFVLLYLLAFKAHLIAMLYLPAFLLALAYHYRDKISRVQMLFEWRTLFRFIIVPTFLAGVALYVFVFGAWKESYALTQKQFERSFLQIITLPAPLDRYSLWSPYHLADLLNLFLLVAAPSILILLTVLWCNRKEISWLDPKLMIFTIASIFPILFFMAMNPMLSPVRDWDVYSLLAPTLAFFAAVVSMQPGVRPYVAGLLCASLVFGTIFTTVAIAVNASAREVQSRLIDAGGYTYQSYYGNSDYIEGRALGIVDTSRSALAQLTSLMERIPRPSLEGKDQELAGMMSRMASLYSTYGDDSSAIVWAARACKTDTRVHRYVVDWAAYCVQSDKLQAGARILEDYLRNEAEYNDTDRSNDQEVAATMAQLGARYSRIGNDSLTVLWGNRAIETEPHILRYTSDLANYYLQSNRPKQALDLFRVIPPDSVSVDVLTRSAIAASYAYGPDSALPYLYKAKTLAPNDRSVDSLTWEMKRSRLR